MPTQVQTEHVSRGRRGLMHWGAIFAGLAIVMALTWLLYLFGAAIGVSVIDATDADALGSGFGISAIVWVILSTLIVFFVASVVAGYISGEKDPEAGMIHGGTLWAVATSVMLVLGWMGVSAMASAGASAVKATVGTTASALQSAAAGTADAAGAVAQGVWSVRDSAVVDDIVAELKDRGAFYASSDAEGVSAAEAERAINQLDVAAIRRIAEQIAVGETERARGILAEETTLSRSQVSAVIAGISQDLQQRLGTAQNETGLAGDLLSEFKSTLAARAARLDEPGGPMVTEAEINTALDQLDRDAAQTIALRLVQGDFDGAKATLVANTTLTRGQVDELVESARTDINAILDDYREHVDEYTETASDYAQGVLWTSFLVGVAGLAVSVVGGWLGTRAAPAFVAAERTSMRAAHA